MTLSSSSRCFGSICRHRQMKSQHSVQKRGRDVWLLPWTSHLLFLCSVLYDWDLQLSWKADLTLWQAVFGPDVLTDLVQVLFYRKIPTQHYKQEYPEWPHRRWFSVVLASDQILGGAVLGRAWRKQIFKFKPDLLVSVIMLGIIWCHLIYNSGSHSTLREQTYQRRTCNPHQWGFLHTQSQSIWFQRCPG